MPKDQKPDKLEMQRRIRIVQEYILQDHITTDIVNNCVKQWGISERQAMRYIAAANEAFAKITEHRLEKRLNYHIQRRHKLLRDLGEQFKKTPAGISTQLNILEDIAKLEKLYTIKVEHTGENGKPIETNTTHKVIFESYAPER